MACEPQRAAPQSALVEEPNHPVISLRARTRICKAHTKVRVRAGALRSAACVVVGSVDECLRCWGAVAGGQRRGSGADVHSRSRC